MVYSGRMITKRFHTFDSECVLTAASSLPTAKLIVNSVQNAATVTVSAIGGGVYKASVTIPAVLIGDVIQIAVTATVGGVTSTGAVLTDVVGDVVSGKSVSLRVYTYTTTGANADATGTPTGTIALNGVTNAASVTVAKLATGTYSYSFTVPTLASWDTMDCEVSATVGGIASGAVVFSYTGGGVATATTEWTTEAALRYLLINDADVQAMIATRAYAQYPPQSTDFPCVIISRSSADYEANMAGSSGYAIKEYDIDGHTMTATSAITLANAVRDALHGYTGSVTVGGEARSIEMLDCMQDDATYVLESDGSDDRIYGFTQRYRVAHAT